MPRRGRGGRRGRSGRRFGGHRHGRFGHRSHGRRYGRHRSRGGGSSRPQRQIPQNDQNTQYLARDDCYLFTTLRFDETLANQRISLIEVDQQLQRVHEEVNHFSSSKYPALISTIFCLGFIYLYYWNLYKSDRTNFALYMILSFFGCFANVILIFCFMEGNNKSLVQKIKIFLEQENLTKWHVRGLHWEVDYELLFIAIRFNWDIEKGQLILNPVSNDQIVNAQSQQVNQMQKMQAQGLSLDMQIQQAKMLSLASGEEEKQMQQAKMLSLASLEQQKQQVERQMMEVQQLSLQQQQQRRQQIQMMQGGQIVQNQQQVGQQGFQMNQLGQVHQPGYQMNQPGQQINQMFPQQDPDAFQQMQKEIE